MKDYEYELTTLGLPAKDLGSTWNAVYNLNRGEAEYELSTQEGLGTVKGFCTSRGILMVEYAVQFHQEVKMTGRSHNPHLDLLFCLGNHTGWDLPESHKVFELSSEESYVGMSRETQKRSIYSPGTSMHMLEIKVPLTAAVLFREEMYAGGGEGNFLLETIPWGKYRVPPSVRIILQQLLHCPCVPALSPLYREGKLLELLAVYLNEAMLQTDKNTLTLGLALDDVRCIRMAKKILDDAPGDNLSLTRLSRLVGLNECKLKKGFKELFGTSIHAYVIQKRLELAKGLLEQERLSVSETAFQVGYGNASHFTAAFRKKYGVNPGEYRKEIKLKENQ